ncbi:hypothetical protein [Luteimicrobium album]|uniref:hypothetical protein n=1 Tax=Luteimicrobium album TaxID=1054550 RepID=UPI0024E0DC4D|nr:hypothetical protein [Luteimicrobium album]
MISSSWPSLRPGWPGRTATTSSTVTWNISVTVACVTSGGDWLAWAASSTTWARTTASVKVSRLCNDV